MPAPAIPESNLKVLRKLIKTGPGSDSTAAMLKHNHKIGKILLKLCPKAKVTGQPSLQEVCDQLNRGEQLTTISHLHQVRDFAAYYPKVEVCLGFKNLYWSHWRILFKVSNENIRNQLAENCNKQSWSVTQLEKKIKESRNPAKKQSPSTTKLRPQKTSTILLKYAELLDSLFEQWAMPGGILSAAHELNPKQLDSLKKARQILDQTLTKMIQSLQSHKAGLQQLLKAK